MSGNSEVMWCPLPRSTLARTDRATSGAMKTVISPADVSSMEARRAGINELHRNSTGASLHSGGRDAIEFDGSSAGIRAHPPFGGGQANAAAAGFDLRRTADVTQIDAATARGCFHAA